MTGERRMVTVIFCDVTGSTAMAEALDPEDVMEIMDGAFDVMIEPIVRYEGTVARLMGDAVLAFFGAPIAHEDDPERACRAALEIVEGARAYAERLEQERGIEGFGVRVGINTGLVVVGEVGSDLRVEYTAMGDAINVAARMEGLAEPGTILITGDTHKLVAPLFETKPLGPVEVKGKAEPIPTYRVLEAKAAPRKLRGVAGLDSPLVGRDAEFDALQRALHTLQRGVGGIVTVVGEAGIGKTRLVAEMREQGEGRVQWVEGRCLSYDTNIAYMLWLDVLRDLLGVTPESPADRVRDLLRERAAILCPESFDEVYPYLAQLMTLPLEEETRALVQGLEPESLKARTFQALETMLGCAASADPLVLVCEDLHWADPTSIEVLEQLLALTDRVPLLTVCVFRPRKEHGSWRVRETAARDYGHRHTDLWLGPLGVAESEALVGNLLRLESLPRGLRGRILAQAEGNPFYVEEFIRALTDAGAIVHDEATGRWQAGREVGEIPIPDTLNGILTARIDRLKEETKRVLQMASVIGRVFLYRVLAAIAATGTVAGEERRLDDRLLTLQREEFIRERTRLPELEYIFKHELTREAAYSGLLKRERRAFHRQVAEALERLFPERIEDRVEVLAHHWERAAEPEQAIHYLRLAGERSVGLSAHQEAVEHFSKALEVLQSLPDTPKRDRRELELRISLIPPLIAVSAYGNPRVGTNLRRVLELGKQLGDPPQLFFPLLGIGAFYGGQAQYRRAEEYWQELLGLAERVGDPTLVAISHWLGWIHLFLGEPARALPHMEQVIDFYDPEQHRSLLLQYGVDPGAICMAWASWALWMLGYPDHALRRAQEALSLARELDHPFTLAFTLGIAGTLLRYFRREVDALEASVEETVSVCEEYGIPYFHAMAKAHRGWVLVQQGEAEEGISLMRSALDALQATGNLMYTPMELTRLAEAHGELGHTEQGLTLVAEAMEVARSTEERYYEPEMHRVRGELMLAEGDEDAAEGSFEEAVQVARQQQARSLELRATVSLCRLWHEQGRREEAREMLSGIYGWFTEGFDTPDLQEAKALLQALS
jgi:adenylate cyclase